MMLRRVGGFLLDLIYPRACAGCGRFGEGFWCPTCALQRKQLRAPTAEIALPDRPLRLYAAAEYASPVREALHTFKYRSTPQLAETFGEWLAAVWTTQALRADMLVPVPLHAGRLRERGYNQSERLAQALSKHTRVPVDDALLRRARNTPHQADLDAAGRAKNVQGAFSANRAIPPGRVVCLLDDVCTTGSTLAECAIVCLNAGAKEVIALTVARADAPK
jgi:competence protein ComFC